MGADHAYAELGLAPGATEAEVKVAWRRLASLWHPDRNRSAAAISRMQRINQALELIRQHGFASSSGAQRSAAGHGDAAAPQRQAKPGPSAAPEAPTDEAAAPGTPDDRHNGTDNGTSSGTDSAAPSRTLSRKIKLTLEEAASGCVKTLRGKWAARCSACNSAGFKVLGTACAECQGSGSVRQRAWYGSYGEASPCGACHGDGIGKQACEPCAGTGKLPAQDYRINVRIPHGVRSGDRLSVGGRRQRAGQPVPQLDLRIEVLPHALFQLGDDGTVFCEMPIDGFAWVAQREVVVPTLDGPQRLRLRREQLSYRLSGLGFPTQRRGPRGDQWLTLQPMFAQQLSTDQEILLDQLVASSTGLGRTPATPQLADWQLRLRDWEKAHKRREQ